MNLEKIVGWTYRLNPLLEELNAQREREGRRPLTWSDLAPLLGMSRQALQNLASNRDLKATNTRFLEVFCRFFGRTVDEVIELSPELTAPVDQDEVDRLVSRHGELHREELPPYHVDRLYNAEAERAWHREHR